MPAPAPPGDSLVRTALRPRLLALLALALALALLFAELGAWQLGRSRASAEAPPERPLVPLQQVLAPQEPLDGEAVAGPVSVRGTWADAPQQLVVDRAPDGTPGEGAWVLAALAVEDGGATALLPVVRGWVPGAPGADPPDPPAGPVELTGELDLSEDPRGVAGLPAGRLAAASSADLLNVWDGRVYAALLVADAPAPGLAAVPAPERESGTNLQNVSYAFQWWVFAAFAVLMWLRVVHDVRRREVERAEDERELAAGEDATPDAAHESSPHHPSPHHEPAPQEASR